MEKTSSLQLFEQMIKILLYQPREKQEDKQSLEAMKIEEEDEQCGICSQPHSWQG